jgi:hypothetical protein
VTHRFKKLIKYRSKFGRVESNSYRGFSIDAPSDAITTYSATSEAQQWGLIVEEDSVVGIMGQD